jgi:hypothetical protein
MNFEYRTVDFSANQTRQAARDDLLNQAGRDGWELISVVPTIINGDTDAFIAFFKRPVAVKTR